MSIFWYFWKALIVFCYIYLIILGFKGEMGPTTGAIGWTVAFVYFLCYEIPKWKERSKNE